MPYIVETCSWLELNVYYFWFKYMVAFDCISYISLRILLTQNQQWPYSSHSLQDIVKIKLTTAPVPPALSSASFPSNNPSPLWHFVDKKPPQTRITSKAAGMAMCFVHWKKKQFQTVTMVCSLWVYLQLTQLFTDCMVQSFVQANLHSIMKLHTLYGTLKSSACSQEPTTAPYPQPHTFSSYPPTIFFKVHISIILLVQNEWSVLLIQICSSPIFKCHSVYCPWNLPNIARKCMEIRQGPQECFMLIHQTQNSHNAEYILTCGVTKFNRWAPTFWRKRASSFLTMEAAQSSGTYLPTYQIT